MSEQLLIIDTSSIRTLAEAGPEALDLLFSNNKRVVVTGDVYEELRGLAGPTGDEFRAWMSRNHDATSPSGSRIILLDYRISFDPNLSDQENAARLAQPAPSAPGGFGSCNRRERVAGGDRKGPRFCGIAYGRNPDSVSYAGAAT